MNEEIPNPPKVISLEGYRKKTEHTQDNILLVRMVKEYLIDKSPSTLGLIEDILNCGADINIIPRRVTSSAITISLFKYVLEERDKSLKKLFLKHNSFN